MKGVVIVGLAVAVLFGLFVLDEITNRAVKARLLAHYQSEPVEFVPSPHAEVLQEKTRSCEMHDEGTETQHLTCWYRLGGNSPVANYKLVGPTPWSMRLFIGRIREEQLIAPSGEDIFVLVPIKE